MTHNMATKRKKKDARKALRMSWGEEIPVINEDFRFFICKGQQFRKNNPNILEVLTVEDKKEDESEEERGDE